jgi:hypothetical protein
MRRRLFFGNFLTMLVALICVAGVAQIALARLPEEGLARAQEAEQALKVGDPQRAIAIFVELDATYPNEPAVNLRLAEIYDQQGQLGAALYYYRRYVQLAGDRARQTAKERVQTLEMTAGAREAADAIAKRLGQKVRPVGTPTPRVEQAIEKVLPDGARVRVDSPEELMSDKVDPKKLVVATPETSQHPLARADVIIREGEETTAGAPAAIRRTPRPIFTPPPLSEPSSGEVAGDQQRTEATPQPSPVASPEVTEEAPARPVSQEFEPHQVGANKISIEFAPAQRTSSTKPREEARKDAVPTATAAQPESPRAVSGSILQSVKDPKTFFICYPAGGDHARLSLSNEMSNAVLVLAALPAFAGDPVNAIVGPGETRSYDVKPGRYVVHVTLRDNSYPPVTLLDTRFDYEFAPGMSYARRFSSREVESRTLNP